jgi:hypothetical protein
MKSTDFLLVEMPFFKFFNRQHVYDDLSVVTAEIYTMICRLNLYDVLSDRK